MSRPTGPDATGPGSMPGNGPEAMPAKVDDKKFVKDAALGGMTEVELGKLAAEKGSSDAVKQFGQKMVDDHSKANEELKQVASNEKMDIPDSLDSKHKSRIDKLSKLSGPDFDKAYLKDQVKDHQQDVSEFQSEAQGGTDPNVKQFAVKTLPVLQDHLSMVKDLNKTSKKESSTK
jgi:putative membrane protein